MARRKPTHNRADVLQAIKVLESLGKTVTSVKYHADGTFRVMTSEHVSKANQPGEAKPNSWDPILT